MKTGGFGGMLFGIILCFSQTLPAQEAGSCEAALDPVLQEKIKLHEQELGQLVNSYVEKFGGFHDPFHAVVNIEEGERIFRRLSVKPKKINEQIKWLPSPLAIINEQIKQTHIHQKSYDEILIRWMLHELRGALQEKELSLTELQSNFLALKYSFEYLRKYKESQSIPDRDGQDTSSEEKTDSEKKNKAPQKAEYPELPEEYKPFTKKMENEKQGEKIRIAEVNFKTSYFAQRYFSEISRKARLPFKESFFVGPFHAPSAAAPSQKELTIKTYGKRKVSLFMPVGFKPLQPFTKNATISRSERGQYILELSEDTPEVKIPLIEEKGIALLSHVRDIYIQAVGFSQNEWPEEIQDNILKKFPEREGTENPLAVAKAISKYISENYVYSEEERPETDPIDALKAGAFQCDLAAFIMVGLLRDVYKIPSRVAGGFPAGHALSEKGEKSFVEVPGSAHAWVEVFHEGQWHEYDPTPGKADQDSLEKENPLAEELEAQDGYNVLQERVFKKLFQVVLDPTQEGMIINNQLHHINQLMRRVTSRFLQEIYQQARGVHGKNHPDLKNWVASLVYSMPKNELNKTYEELHRLQLAVELYSRVLDTWGDIPLPTKLLQILKALKEKLNALAHPDSQNIGLVRDFIKDLPSVVRLLLKTDYGLSSVGANSPTQSVAQKLKDGKLNDLRLLSLLSPMSDFILNATPWPETMDVKTWQRSSTPRHRRDLLPTQRFSDFPKALLGQPGKDFEQNLREGTVFVATQRKEIKIPLDHGQEESERMTFVLYDTSGSMDGEPGRFQAGIISAFVAKAVSDVSPSGKHRHKVLLIPFDTNPGQPIRITNTNEALDVIRNYQSKLKNTNGGTDIQLAMVQAFRLMALAEKKSGEPLAAANIILMTDGGSNINVKELIHERNKVNRKTPVQTMFISINATNEELRQFANDSKSMGVEKGFYREFSSSDIHRYLEEADHLDLKQRQDFYTEREASELPLEVHNLMEQLLRSAAEFSAQIHNGGYYKPPHKHLEDLEKIKWQDLKHKDRPLEQWIVRVRKLLRHPIFRNKKTLEKVTHDLIVNFEKVTHIDLNTLSDYEQEQLRHLVRFAAGLE